MDNPQLAEGASFGEIVEDTPITTEPEVNADEGTPPVEGAETKEVATEGDIPAAFKEKAPETTDGPDLSVDADLQKHLDAHPIVKAKVEAFLANKEKGVTKFIAEQAEKAKSLPELEKFKEDYTPLVDFYGEFNDPSTVDAAVDRLMGTLEQTYGRSFRGAATQAQTTTTDPDADPTSKYGLEYASDDKVVDAVLKALDSKLDDRLGTVTSKLEPLAKHIEGQQQREQVQARATQALGILKQDFEVSGDPWITPEKVQEAMTAYPGVEPAIAFRAHFTTEIGRYFAKHSTGSNGQKARPLPQGTSGGTSALDLPEGATFGQIMAAETTLG